MSDQSGTWPTVRSWTGDDQRHPLQPVLHDAEAGDASAGFLLTSLEELLRRLEDAQPNRWQGKRRTFRSLRNSDAMFSLRSELVLAARLVECGVRFEFGEEGDRPQPDLVLPDLGIGIELASRNTDGAQELEQAIAAALEADELPLSVRLTYDYQPMMIRTSVIQGIVEQVRQGQPVDTEIRPADPRLDLPACRVQIEATPSDQIRLSRNVVDSCLTWTMRDIVHEIRRTVLDDDRKLAQARSMPTILVVDMSRCSIAWIGSLDWRLQELRDLLNEAHPYIGVGVMVAGYETNTPQLKLAPNPHSSAADALRIEQLLSQLACNASTDSQTTH